MVRDIHTVRLSTSVCYPDFSPTSLFDNTIREYSDYRLAWVKRCRPRTIPATALSKRIGKRCVLR